jgi:hypothetical protein
MQLVIFLSIFNAFLFTFNASCRRARFDMMDGRGNILGLHGK